MKSSILKELQRIELAIRGIDPLADIAELEAAQSDMQALIDALEATDASLWGQIVSNSSVSANLQSQISSNDSDISGNNSRISALEALGGGASGLSMAVLSDVKPAQTGGGTATSGAWRTRDLNTITDPDSIIFSLSGNQFVLPAGDYIIIASSPAYKVAHHQIRLQDISSNTTALLGTTEYSGQGGYYATTRSAILGFVTPATNTTFEIQHLVYSTFALAGFGDGYSWPVPQDSVYTQVLVIKL